MPGPLEEGREEAEEPSYEHSGAEPVALGDIESEEFDRIPCGFDGIDEMFEGGLPRGSNLLLFGAPGTGKSRILTSIALRISERFRVLYACGEESPSRLRARASVLSPKLHKNSAKNLVAYPSTIFEEILEEVDRQQPDVLIVDSLSTISSREVDGQTGGVVQVKHLAEQLKELVKQGSDLCTFAICHETKSGAFAGPKALEHQVDAMLVLSKEIELPDRNIVTLRITKNRFGAAYVNDVYLEHLEGGGLSEVSPPEEDEDSDETEDV